MKNQIICLVAILLLTSTTVVFAQSNKYDQIQDLFQNQTTKNQLISVAKTALQVELDLQVNERDSVQNVSDEKFAGAMQERFAIAFAHYNQNALIGKKAKGSEIRVYDEKLKIRKNKATLFLTAFSQVTYIDSDGEPFESGGETKYKFEFEFQKDHWVMTNVADISFDNYSVEFPVEFYEKTENSSEVTSAPQGVAPTVIRSGVVSYAIRYVYSPNSAYRVFEKDCTNFISQSLSNNGWAMIWGNRTSNSSWYYHGEPFSFYPYSTYQSYTWAVAHNFSSFAQSRASGYSNPSESNWGDVVQVDFTGDKKIDHTAIVTKLDSGEVYLTYRSADYLNRPLSYFRSNYPKAVYHGWHLNFDAKEINITGLSPSSVRVGQGVWLTVTGMNFKRGLKASVNQWAIADTGVSYKNSNTVLVYVVMNNRGSYTLQLKNPDGTVARKNFSVS